LIASIELGKIVEDADLRSAYDETAKEADMPATFEEALQELEEETGIDLNRLSRGWLFMDMSRLERFAPYLGIIVEGSFDKGELVATIEEAGEEFATTEYKGYRIHIFDEEDGGGLAFLNDGVLVVGSMDAVEDVDSKSPAENVIRNDLREKVIQALSTLTPREEKILRLRFGIDGGEAMTLERIGQHFNLTKERIRQIEGRALHRLLQLKRRKHIY